MLKDALYYPYIGLKNPDLIKSMALLYNFIYRIVPDNVIPDDSEELQPLLEEGSVGKMVAPEHYAEQASSEFLEGIETWDAAALGFDEEEVSRLHENKIDQVVKRLFVEAGFTKDNKWFHVPSELASNYMLFMARNISIKNDLALVTDNWGAWTGTNYFNLNGTIDESVQPLGYGNEFIDDPFGLFSMIISGIYPINIDEIPTEKIVEFRKKRSDEINNFRLSISELHDEIKNTVDGDISIDRIERKAKELQEAANNYKKSADLITVKKWIGTFMAGVPAPVTLCNIFKIPVATVFGLASTCVAMGGLYNTYAAKEEIKKLNKENPASFLIELRNHFKDFTAPRGSRNGGDINMHAWNCIEEYIND